jgi:hypothetical protein
MSRERTAAGNILAIGRSREEQAKAVEETATSYMPTNIDLEAWLPEGDSQDDEVDDKKLVSPPATGRARRDKPTAGAIGDTTRRKRISLYLDDDVLTKVFRVSLEQHEQLSAATHRLILEALKARGM